MADLELWRAVLYLGWLLLTGGLIVKEIFFQNTSSVRASIIPLIQNVVRRPGVGSRMTKFVLYIIATFLGMISIQGMVDYTLEGYSLASVFAIMFFIVSVMISLIGWGIGKYGFKGKKAWIQGNKMDENDLKC